MTNRESKMNDLKWHKFPDDYPDHEGCTCVLIVPQLLGNKNFEYRRYLAGFYHQDGVPTFYTDKGIALPESFYWCQLPELEITILESFESTEKVRDIIRQIIKEEFKLVGNNQTPESHNLDFYLQNVYLKLRKLRCNIDSHPVRLCITPIKCMNMKKIAYKHAIKLLSKYIDEIDNHIIEYYENRDEDTLK